MKTLGTYKIPAVLAERECNILVDMVDSNIPLLLSKTSMIIDYGTNEVKIAGRRIKAFETTAGHLCIPLHPNATEPARKNKQLIGGSLDEVRVGPELPKSRRDGSLERWTPRCNFDIKESSRGLQSDP